MLTMGIPKARHWALGTRHLALGPEKKWQSGKVTKWQSKNKETRCSAAVSGSDLCDGGDDVGKVSIAEVVVHGEGQDLLGK